MKNRLVPQHSLALSIIASPGIPGFEVSYDEAIRYLQRQETGLEFSGRGWHVIRYQTHNLGWVNVLGNRINNYYPKELRILKQSGHSTF
jgi:NOL1/NOP2/fmu family ribosome biogenesis protein